MSGSPNPSRRTALPQSGTAALELPADLVSMLEKEARAHRKTIPVYMREWLEERAEARAAERALRAAQKVNKGKPTIAAADLYRECGI